MLQTVSLPFEDFTHVCLKVCLKTSKFGVVKKNLKTINNCNATRKMFTKFHRYTLLQSISVRPYNKWLQSDIRYIQNMKKHSANSGIVDIEMKAKIYKLKIKT